MFSVGQKMRLFVTTTGDEVTSGSICYFWAQTNFDGYSIVEELMNNVDENETRLSYNDISTGDVVLAKYTDGVWYRAQVQEKLESKNAVKVIFIDFGNTEEEQCTNILKGSSKYFTVEPLATKFILADIIASNEKKWNTDEISIIENILHNMEPEAEVVSVGSAGIPTTIRLINTSGNRIADELVSMGCGKVYDNSHNKCQAIPICKLSSGKQYHVFISYIMSSMKFWVQLSSFTDHIDRMDRSLLEYVTNGLPKLGTEIAQGMPCVAMYEEAYYRGVVTSVNYDKKSSTIYFVDYGNSAEVNHMEVYMLPREEGFQHALCAECTCKGDIISTDVQAYLESEDVYINVLSALDSGAYVVEFTNTIHEHASPPRAITKHQSNAAQVSLDVPVPSTVGYSPFNIDKTASHDICISHVERSGSFHCQLVKSAAKLESLMCQLSEEVRIPLSGTLKTGTPCIAKHPKERVSYRGEILENSINGISVKLVDFGSIETFSISDLSVIRPDFVVKIPVQSIHCVLKGSDTSDPSQIFSLLKSYESKVSLHAVVNGTGANNLLLVDLYDLQKGGNSLEKLLNDTDNRQKTSLNPSSNVFIPPAEVNNKMEKVFPLVVLSDSEVFCQLTKYSQQALESFQAELADHYSNMPSMNTVKVGDVCCTEFSEDGCYYRAKIIRIVNDKVEVSLVDYGNIETKDITELKVLDSHFCNLPVQGIVCCFHQHYPEITKAGLEEILNREWIVDIQTKDGHRFHVTLLDCADNADANRILNRGLAMSAYVKCTKIKGKIFGFWFQGTSSDVQKSGKLQVRDISVENSLIDEYQDLEVEKSMWDNCLVTHVEDPETFYLQFLSSNDALNSVMDKLESHCVNLGPEEGKPRIIGLGVPVAAKYKEDDAWYRASISGILQSGKVEVVYVDFGNSDIVEKSDLRFLTEELLQLPVQAIRCTLNRMLLKDSDMWSSDDIEEFKSLVEVDESTVHINSFMEAEKLYFVELYGGPANINQQFLLPRNKLKKSEPSPGNPPDTLPYYPSKAVLKQKYPEGPTLAGAPPVDGGGWEETDVASSDFGKSGGSGPGFGSQNRSGGGFGDNKRSGGGFGDNRSGGGFGDNKSRSAFGDNSSGGGFGDGNRGGSGNKSGFSDGENGSERSFGSRERGGHGGNKEFSPDEMIGIEVPRNQVGRIIGKGGSRIKEIIETSGAKIEILSKDAAGDQIPIEIFGTEEARNKAKQIIEDIVNTTFGGARGTGFSRGGENQGGFFSTTKDDWASSNSSQTKGFTGKHEGRFSDGNDDWRHHGDSGNKYPERPGGFGNNRQESFSGADKGNWREKDTGSDGFRSKPKFNNSDFDLARSNSIQGQDWGTVASSIQSPSTFVYKDMELELNGEYIDVYITHHESPSLFYCQLQKTYSQLEDLMAKIQDYYGSLGVPDMAMLNFIKDRVCVAKFSEDNKWYRAKVISAKGGMVNVLFVDYGNSEELTPVKIKDIREEFISLPVQAIPCSLFGIKPSGNEWSNDAIERFISMTCDEVIATATDRLPGGKYIMDLNANNESVHEVLIKKGFGDDLHDDFPMVPTKRKLSVGSSSSSTSSKSSSFATVEYKALKQLTLSSGQILDVNLSHSDNPGQFWIHLGKNVEQLNRMTEDLFKTYEGLSNNELNVTNPKVGNLCCAKWEEDESWYRSVIKKVNATDVQVEFIDFGNRATINIKNIKQLQKQFTSLPIQGICCKLDGVVPTGSQWTEAALTKFDDLLVDVKVKAQVNSTIPPYLVSLTITSSGATVAEELIQGRFARPGREAVSSKPLIIKNFKKGDRHNIGISWMINAKEFYCQLVNEEQELCQLQEKLCDTYENSRLSDDRITNPKSGDYCVAYYPADGNWYRSLILEIQPSNSAKVQYVDYGNTEIVPQSKLKVLKPEFSSQSCFAFKCSLNMAGVELKWSAPTISVFKSLIQQRLKCHIDHVRGDINVVDLLDSTGNNIVDSLKNQDFAGNKARNPGFGRTSNDFQSDTSGGRRQKEGFGSDKSRELGYLNNNQRKEGGFGDRQNTFAQRDNGDPKQRDSGFGRKNASGDNFSKRGGFGGGFGTSQTAGENEEWGEESVQVSVIKQSVVKDCPVSPRKVVLPASSMPDGKQEFYISNVVSPKEFYVQLVSKEDEINELIDKITTEYDVLGEDEKVLVNPIVDQICCGKFEGGWYRAKIENISGNNATILFVDYGNTDTVLKSTLKVLTHEHTTKAPLAYKCRLDRFVVHNDDDTVKLNDISEGGSKVLKVEFLSKEAPYKVNLFNPDEPLINLATSLPSFESQPKEADSNSYLPFIVPCDEVTAFVSNIESPGKFYIQLQSHESDLTDMAASMETFKSGGNKLLEISVGTPCAALFSEDENWYRGEILSVSSNNAEVLFIDYGNVENVNIGSLKAIPENLLRKPPYSVRCTLQDITQTEFSESVSNAFVEMALEKDLQVTFISQIEPCCVKILEGTVNVNNKMKEIILQNLPESQEIFEKIKSYPEQPKLKGFYQGFVEHVENPNHLYIQLVRDQDAKNEIEDAIDSIYGNDEENPGVIEVIETGMPCCASQDNVKYRAVVTSLGAVNTVNVQFVDYGNADEVPKKDVQILTDKLLEKHPLAYRARLSRTIDTESGWSNDVTDKLFDEATSKTLNIEVKSETEPYEVELLYQGESINDSIISVLPKELVIKDSIQSEDNSSEQYESAVEDGSNAGTLDEDYQETRSEQNELDEASMSICDVDKEIISAKDENESDNDVDTEFADAEELVPDQSPADSSNVIKVSFNIGSKHEVYVSHNISPTQFWINTVKQEVEFMTLQENLQEYYSEDSNREMLTLDDISVGMLCVARYEIDETTWYRARVQSISDSETVVHFIDYGDTSVVSLACLCGISTQFLETPAYAVECLLHGVRAINGEWSEESKDKFEELVKDKKLIAEIVASEGGPEDTHMAYMVRLLDMGIPVAKYLIDNDLAEDNGTPLPSSYILASQDVINNVKVDDDKPVLNSVSMTVGEKLEGTVVYVESPGRFWIQLQQYQSQLKNLVHEMKNYYSSVDTKSNKGNLSIGDVCVAYCESDVCWYRASIQENINSNDDCNKKVKVKYVDYGNEESIQVGSLCVLEPIFAVLPSQGLECSYCDIIPHDKDNDIWDPEAADVLCEATMEKKLLIEVIDISDRGVYSVKLLDMGLPVSNRLLAEGLVQRLGPNPDLTLQESNLEYTAVEVPRNEKSSSDKADGAKYKMPKLEEGQTWNVYISHVDSPHSLYCQLITSSSDLPLFADKLVDYYSSLNEHEERLQIVTVGQACVAQYSEDDSWYRAKVTDIEDDNITLLFVDYGNSEVTNINNIRVIHQDFLNLPVQAFLCQLFSIEPMGGGSDWDEDSCCRLNEICLREESNEYDSRVFKASFKKLHKDESGEIVMVDIFLNDGDTSLENLLVEGGYAQKKQITTPDTQNGSIFEGDINSIAEKIVFDTIEQSKKIYMEEQNINTSEAEELHRSVNVSVTRTLRRSSMELSGYDFPELEEGSMLDVQYLKGESPDDFCLQMAGNANIELEALMSRIESYCSDATIEDKENVSFSVGQACLAVFSEDGKWYRASVISIQEENYEVKFVDYGYKDVVNCNQILPLKEHFSNLPIQALNCRLTGVVPLEGDEWTLKSSEFFETLCSGVDLCAKIMEKEIDVYKIYLYNSEDTADNKSINHQLVISEHAVWAKGFEMHLDSDLNSASKETSFLDVSACMSNSLGSLDESGTVESTDGDVFNHLKYHAGQTTEMIFVTCNDDHIICQPVDSLMSLEDLMSQLNKCYSGEEPILDDPQVGQPCCVKSSVDDRWHRAEVCAVVGQGDMSIIKCRAIDSGDSIPASSDRVKLLRQEFLSLPAQAVTIYISNLAPFGELSTKVYDLLESNFASEDGKVYLNVRVDQAVADGSVKATVFTSSGCSLIDELLANELLPGSTPKEEDSATSCNDDDPIDNAQHSDSEEFQPWNGDIIRLKSLLKPEIIIGDVYDVILSCAESPSNLWCQISNDNHKAQLEKMQEYYNNFDTACDMKFEEGEYCVALCNEENHWYRAKIQSAYEGVYSVLNVDTGVSDTTNKVVPLTKELSKIPNMALNCTLKNVYPKEKDWSEAVTALLSSFLSEPLSMTVTEVTDIDLYHVDLAFKDKEYTVREILLEKKVVRTDIENSEGSSEEKEIS